jgi:hypothetical protein
MEGDTIANAVYVVGYRPKLYFFIRYARIYEDTATNKQHPHFVRSIVIFGDKGESRSWIDNVSNSYLFESYQLRTIIVNLSLDWIVIGTIWQLEGDLMNVKHLQNDDSSWDVGFGWDNQKIACLEGQR